MATKLKNPFVGIIAFVTVLLTQPLGHYVMVQMEEIFGHTHVFYAAGLLGFLGVILLIWGILSQKQIIATLLGLFAGIFVWTGWIEFSFVYYAHRFNVQPLIENGEIVTKPEYLIMPSSVGFWAVFMIYYFFGTKTGCTMLTWSQKNLKIVNPKKITPNNPVRNTALTTFMEIIIILWTFYLLLLFLYDKEFIGDDSILMYFVAYGSLFWSVYLFIKLLKIKAMPYAIRYAIPTVIIFWNFVEILGRWDVFTEIWVHPSGYVTEMLLITLTFVLLILFILFEQRRRKK